jgi:DNA-binding response OmpR family regulator
VRQKVLVIDDEEDLCSLILRILSEADYETQCAQTLEEGKRKWENWEPAIVILDYNLPDGTAFDMLDTNTHLLKKSLIILTTADAQDSTRVRANRLGIPIFINKPFSMRDIRKVVESLSIDA